MTVPPLPELLSLLALHQLWQHSEHGPDQPFGSPGIINGSLRAQHGLHQLAETAPGKRKAHESADSVDAGQPFAKPTARGPSVDHHLHLFERLGRVEIEILGEELS